jgi:hypothetical protein
MAEEKQESKKTLVSFVVGLLIGGLLVWAFSGPAVDAPQVNTEAEDDSAEVAEENDESEGEEEASENNEEGGSEAAEPPVVTLPVGDGNVEVNNQPAGSSVALESVVFPIDEGWIAVRTYTDSQLGNILGAARFSSEQGLMPEAIELLAPTVSGREYAIVFFSEDGDRQFNLAGDVQIDQIFATFTAE